MSPVILRPRRRGRKTVGFFWRVCGRPDFRCAQPEPFGKHRGDFFAAAPKLLPSKN
jgi:hypothetical protein